MAAEAERTTIGKALADLAARREALAGRQAALERTLRELDARAADLAAKLPRTMVVREAEALMAEQRSVNQRRSDVEDDELALLEEDDGLDEEESGHRARLVEVDASVGSAAEALASAEALLDAQLDDLGRRREDAAAPVPPGLLTRYDDLRRRLGGVAVAELHDGRCSGCHLQLSAVALEAGAERPAGRARGVRGVRPPPGAVRRVRWCSGLRAQRS